MHQGQQCADNGLCKVWVAERDVTALPILQIVTPSDTKVGPSLVNLATEDGVLVIQHTTNYDPDTGEFVVNEGKMLHPSLSPIGSLPDHKPYEPVQFPPATEG
ncbi:MAG: hypothetical protein P8X51_08525, partial [Maritimibacter sp.]